MHSQNPFSALTLLIGRNEGNQTWKILLQQSPKPQLLWQTRPIVGKNKPVKQKPESKVVYLHSKKLQHQHTLLDAP